MILTAPAAAADCLGVSRTIRLDARQGNFYDGLERSLGLRDGEVVLTFDDGPMPGTTTRILDALRAECTRATFFMAGRMADAYPAIAQRVRREGHTVAGHTHAHENLARLPSGSVAAAIDKGNASIQRATGQRSTPFFRYPYLARSARTDEIVRSKGLIAFGTNIDSKDYYEVSPATVRAKVMAQLRRQRRGIVLMHDIQGRTAAMLPALLDQMKAEGFRVVHIVPGRGGAPVADTVLARAAPAIAPEVASEPVTVAARSKPAPERADARTDARTDAKADARRRGAAVLAAFAEREPTTRAASRVDVVGGGTVRATMTRAQKRRAARVVRREFRTALDLSGRHGPLLRLEAR